LVQIQSKNQIQTLNNFLTENNIFSLFILRKQPSL
jgi:hypothetical protein